MDFVWAADWHAQKANHFRGFVIFSPYYTSIIHVWNTYQENHILLQYARVSGHLSWLNWYLHPISKAFLCTFHRELLQFWQKCVTESHQFHHLKIRFHGIWASAAHHIVSRKNKEPIPNLHEFFNKSKYGLLFSVKQNEPS